MYQLASGRKSLSGDLQQLTWDKVRDVYCEGSGLRTSNSFKVFSLESFFSIFSLMLLRPLGINFVHHSYRMYIDYLLNASFIQLTKPDVRLPQSRVGGQGLYLRSLDHLGRSSEAKKI